MMMTIKKTNECLRPTGARFQHRSRNLRVRFDKSMVKNDLSKSRVHGVVHGQSLNNS